MQVTTFAAITIGSYDVSLEIFDISKKYGIRSVDTVRCRLELGKDAYTYGKIGPLMVESLCRILKDFARIMEGYKVADLKVITTSAIREAENNLFILDRIHHLTGLDVEILSNSELRLLNYKAVSSLEGVFHSMIEKGTALVDVDGGSIQLSLFDKDALVTTINLRMGNLRVREKLQDAMTETTDYVRLVEELIQNEITSFQKMYLKNRRIENVVLGGDFISLINIPNLKGETGGVVSREAFNAWYDRAVGCSDSELAVRMNIPVEYASLLQPTAIIFHRLVNEMQAKQVWIPGTHLARGLAYDYAVQKKILRMDHDFENDIIQAARHIGKRYEVSQPHDANVEMTALTMYDALKKIHGGGDRERLLLRLAVMLHDVGKYISVNYAAESSYSIIMGNEIIGLSHREREMIALITKYNGVDFPEYDILAEESNVNERQYIMVAELTAVLRLANALDRSHMQKVVEISAVLKERKLVLNLTVNRDYVLEKALAIPAQDFFEEVFGIRPVLKVHKQM